MAYIPYSSISVSDDWVVDTFPGGDNFNWFRVSAVTQLPSSYLLLLGCQSVDGSQMLWDVQKYYPSERPVIRFVSLPAGFNQTFHWTARVARWYNPNNPITLNFDYWQP